jgi:hypothetical protein
MLDICMLHVTNLTKLHGHRSLLASSSHEAGEEQRLKLFRTLGFENSGRARPHETICSLLP